MFLLIYMNQCCLAENKDLSIQIYAYLLDNELSSFPPWTAYATHML